VQTQVLVVDDEKAITRLIAYHLEREGYKTNCVHDGETACRLLRSEDYDLMILDLMLPGMSGWDVLRDARQRGNSIPVIILSARGDEVDKVAGLELGADDYVTKPFSARELVARVRAHLRRKNAKAGGALVTTPLELGNLVINGAKREVTVAGKPIALTTKEFDLLYHLAQSPGHVFSRENLLQSVWGYDFEGDTRTVDVHVSRIRQKIDPVLDLPEGDSAIQTVRGIGYRLSTKPLGRE